MDTDTNAEADQTDADAGFTIVGVTMRCFMALHELNLTPGKVTMISGRNGVGKSSVLDGIEATFQASGASTDLIQRGQEKAELLVDLGAFQISRRITAAGNYLDVTQDDGKLLKPQAKLDALVGPALVFSPVEFCLAKPQAQREMLLQAVPIVVSASDLEEWFGSPFTLDYSRHGLEVLAEVEDMLFEERAGANTRAKEHEQTIAVVQERIPEGFDVAKWRGTVVTDLAGIIREAQDARNRHSAVNDQCGEVERNIALAEQHKAGLEEQLAHINKELSQSAEKLAKLEAERDAIEIPDDTEAQQALAEHTEAMAVLADVDTLEGAQVKLAVASTEADELTASLALAREKPAQLLAAAELPIEGLEITADSITVNDIPIARLADSEQLLLGLDVARALTRDVHVLCIDSVEKLDAENFALLVAQAKNDDKQYFLSMVTAGDLTITDLTTASEDEILALATGADDGSDA